MDQTPIKPAGTGKHSPVSNSKPTVAATSSSSETSGQPTIRGNSRRFLDYEVFFEEHQVDKADSMNWHPPQPMPFSGTAGAAPEATMNDLDWHVFNAPSPTRPGTGSFMSPGSPRHNTSPRIKVSPRAITEPRTSSSRTSALASTTTTTSAAAITTTTSTAMLSTTANAAAVTMTTSSVCTTTTTTTGAHAITVVIPSAIRTPLATASGQELPVGKVRLSAPAGPAPAPRPGSEVLSPEDMIEEEEVGVAPRPPAKPMPSWQLSEIELVDLILLQSQQVLIENESSYIRMAAEQPGVLALEMLHARGVAFHPFRVLDQRGWRAEHCPFKNAIAHQRYDNVRKLLELGVAPSQELMASLPDLPEPVLDALLVHGYR